MMLTRLARSRSDDAAAFYESRAGQRAAFLLNRRLRTVMPSLTARRILGVGYTHPYLPGSASFAVSGRLQTPQTQRLSPIERILPDCIIESNRLPFDDLSMDAVMIVHGLEFARSVPDFLRAVWRVMTDDGCLILVTPNRSGAWAHTDATPFGHGSPFSTNQLARVLGQGMFRIERHTGALMAPPIFLNTSNGTIPERLGRATGYPLAGVHVVLARKNAYAGLPLLEEGVRAPISRQIAEPA